MEVGQNRSFKHLCKAKNPPKIKIWLWLIWHNFIATKDNMLKRGWQGDPKCRFCEELETIHHLFFNFPAAVYMWSVISTSLGVNNMRLTSLNIFFGLQKILRAEPICMWWVWQLFVGLSGS